jgi:uncharacterized membrane-anchored protein
VAGVVDFAAVPGDACRTGSKNNLNSEEEVMPHSNGRFLLLLIVGALSILALCFASAGQGAEPAPPSNEDRLAAELEAAYSAAAKVAQHGPAEIKLASQALFKLPEKFVFVPKNEAAQIMHAYGNRTGDDFLGAIFPQAQENWFVILRFVQEGYIKDDDAKHWDAGDMLASFKEGTEEGNKERRARGIPEIEIIDWAEKPRYDVATHQLVWAMSSREKGAPDSAGKGINYNTYTLGREGYISMNLVTDLAAIERHKPVAKTLLAGLSFEDGKRYADFNGSTDKIAAYGLAALVGGVAAKKLGLLAVIGVFLAKFWKVIVVAVAAGGGMLSKLRKRPK